MSKIFHTIASPEVEADLNWFYNESDSDMGLKSSWSAMVEIALSGGGAKDPARNADPMSSARIEASWRQRGIKRCLDRIPQRLARALQRAYETQRWAPELVVRFGRLTGVAIHTQAATQAYEKAVRHGTPHTFVGAWLVSAVHYNETALLADIQIESETLLAEAYAAYHEAARDEAPVPHRRAKQGARH